MAFPLRVLVGALAEIFSMDEGEVYTLLRQEGIASWQDFVDFLNLYSFHRRGG